MIAGLELSFLNSGCELKVSGSDACNRPRKNPRDPNSPNYLQGPKYMRPSLNSWYHS